MTSRARGVAAATLDKETPLYWSSGKFQLESDGLFAQTTLFRVYSRTLHYPILGDFRDHTTLLWDSRSMVRIQWSRPEALRRHVLKAIGRCAPRNLMPTDLVKVVVEHSTYKTRKPEGKKRTCKTVKDQTTIFFGRTQI